LRFAVHRPGIPAASPRSHGVPRRDIHSRVHISMAGVSAGSAPEDGLALARLRIHLPARRAPLARKRRIDLLYPARRLLFQAAHHQAPRGSQDLPVQPGFLPDPAARTLPVAFRGPGHVPDPQVFDQDQVEPLGDVRRRLLGPVLAPVRLPSPAWRGRACVPAAAACPSPERSSRGRTAVSRRNPSSRPALRHDGRPAGLPGSQNAATARAKSRRACCCTIWDPLASHGCSARAWVSCRHCSR
jgi:hypothetical protein